MSKNEDDSHEGQQHEVVTFTNNTQTSAFYRNWVGFFILGLCTHLPYTIVNTAANTIAESLDASSFVATIYGAGSGPTVAIRIVNAFLLYRVAYGARFFANGVIMLAGICGIAFSQSFLQAILFIVLVGASNGFGENIALGYLTRFDSRHITAWASGFELAGLLGAILYVVFGCLIDKEGNRTDMRKLDKWAFVSMVPAVAIYLMTSLLLIKSPNVPIAHNTSLSIQDADGGSFDDQTTPLLQNTTDILRVQQESHVNETTSAMNGSTITDTTSNSDGKLIPTFAEIKAFLQKIKRCFKLVAWLAFNLAVIQFTSYNIRVAAAKARHKGDVATCPEVFASLQLCFQVGVFASQSSLPIVKVRRVGFLTALQVINMLLWMIHDKLKFLPVALLPFLMLTSGALRGSVYVNVFYMIRTDPRYPDEIKEMCANVAAIFLTVGLSFSCILQTVLFNTVLLLY